MGFWWIGVLIYGEFVGYDSKARFERMVGFGGWWRSVGFQVVFDFVLKFLNVQICFWV